MLHRAASATQQKYEWANGTESVSASFPKAQSRAEEFIHQYARDVDADDIVIALSDPTGRYWRKKVLPSYKMNRSGVAKPVLFRNLREWCEDAYECVWKPGLEGDDVMGILLTNPNKYPGTKVVVTVDKDALTVPGLLYRPHRRKDGVIEVTEAEADRNHLLQTLTGDPTDGFYGIKGIGPKKAAAILDAPPRPHMTHSAVCDCTPWSKVVRAYGRAGLTYDDALTQARVAFILRHGYYNQHVGVRLWTPPEQEPS